MPQQDRPCLEMCDTHLFSAQLHILCLCTIQAAVNASVYKYFHLPLNCCHLTLHVLNASPVVTFCMSHKMSKEAEQLLDQITSTGQEVHDPDSNCEQHEVVQRKACNYAINNLPIVPSSMPSVS